MKKSFILILLFCFTGTFVSAQCAFTVTVNISNPTCYNFSDGNINLLVSGGTGNLTFEVTDSTGTVLNGGGGNTVNNLPGGWYYYSITDQSPCTETDSVFLVNPPQINFDLSFTQQALCFGDSLGYVWCDTVYNYQGNFSNIGYFWNPNYTGTNGIGVDSMELQVSGVYTLVVNDEVGCIYDSSFTVQPAPSEINVVNNLYEPCYNGGGQWGLTATGGTPPYNWIMYNAWTGDTIYTNTWTNMPYGVYYYEVHDANGCAWQFNNIDSLTVGCSNTGQPEINIDLYPNPNQGSFTLLSDHNGLGNLKIYNMNGQVIYESSMKNSKMLLDLNIPSGIYWLLLKTADGVARERIVIE